jgi:hypothetical protein
VGEARAAGEQGSLTAEAAGRGWRLASPATAVALGALGLALMAVWVALTYLSGDVQVSRDGAALAFALVCGFVGMLVARRQPRNPEGWLLLGAAVCVVALLDSGLYAVLDYHLHHGRLPLGKLAVFVRDSLGTPILFLLALVILLFPDGRLARPWKWVLWLYLAVMVVATTGIAASEAGTLAGSRIRVDVNGSYSGPGSAGGVLGTLAAATQFAIVLVPPLWCAFGARQVLSWRRASGERRQQLKWLMSGSVIALAGLALIAFGPPNDELAGRVVRDLAFVCVAALPVSICIGILKYHLYDIDRIISRTLAYAIVTGLLVGVYTGVVLLATRVLPLSSPVAVAASTLVAAALFSPLRRWVQRAVDRRFNRARYDADKTVAAFAAHLQDAVDLDAVRDDLAGVVRRALEPAHVSVWINQRD